MKKLTMTPRQGLPALQALRSQSIRRNTLRYRALLVLFLLALVTPSSHAAQQTRAPTTWWCTNVGNSGPGPNCGGGFPVSGSTLDPYGNCESCVQASGGWRWNWHWTGRYLDSGCEYVGPDQILRSNACFIGAMRRCEEGFTGGSLCVANGDPDPGKNNGGCVGSGNPGVGNPCNPTNGNKFQRELDYLGSGPFPLRWERSYNSVNALKDGSMGPRWLSSYDSYVSVSTSGGITTATVTRPDGKAYAFNLNNGVGAPDSDINDKLVQLVDGSGNLTGWQYTVYRLNEIWTYDTTGRPISITNRAGLVQSISYVANLLVSITDPFGRQVTLGYNSSRQLTQVTDLAGGIYSSYAYDAQGMLTRVDYPDLTAKLYHYENTNFPHHLTGISYVDALGVTTRYATYAYDTTGKAITTQHAVTDNVAPQEKFTLAYDSATQTTVTDPININEIMTFQVNLGVKNLVSKVNQSDNKSMSQVFDANNNLTCQKDEENHVTLYSYNPTNQKLSMTEGLTGDCTNPVSVTGVTRITTYQYLSSTFDLPTIITAPSVSGGSNRKTTTIQYTDPSHPSLPTVMTQSGFTSLGSAVARTVSLGYNASGQVNSIDGPRTDVSDATTLEYYACTTGGACGQLKKVTNALGHVTTYDLYDLNGRLLQTTDPNGLVTNYTYDPRGRLTTLTQTPPAGGGAVRTAQYTYTPFGAVKTLTTPDGVTLTYGYDAAQYLRTITDNLGNKVTYHYDLKGNRDNEETFDPDGTLVRTISYASDLRNQLKTIDTAGSITQLVSDAVGNLSQSTDPNQSAAVSGIATTHQYDSMNRLLETIDNLTGQAQYSYDINDRLTQAKAPNNATTQYQYDDLSNLLKEINPDRGTTAYTHDSAGNVKTITDARGVLATYTYDALNRISAIDYPGVTDDVAFQYDQSSTEPCTAGRGRLCQAVDSNASTAYAYDVYGNRTRESRLGHTLRYTFDAGNRINTITYPSGMLITYIYAAVGRIKDVTRTEGTLTTTIIGNRTYRADGLMKTQSFGNGLSETRNHDLQGRLQNQAVGSVYNRAYPLYDPNGNVKQIATTSTPAFSGQYNYDALDRLLQDTNNINSHGFGYDGNGNRTLDNAIPYIYPAASNRLSSIGGSGVEVALTYDAAGNITQDTSYQIYTYDAPGRLASVTVNGVTTTYRYNASGQRTEKQRLNEPAVRYYTGQNGELLAETNGNGTPIAEYVYAEGVPIAQLRYAPDPGTPLPPTITGFWPGSGPENTIVFVFGSGFIPQATSVQVNGINAPLKQVLSSDLLFFLLPAGNTQGPITVTTAQGQASNPASFGNVTTGVQVSGIWPAQGSVNTIVFVFGSGFVPLQTQVSFNLTSAPLKQVLDGNMLFALVPEGATTGPVKATTAQGSALSAIPFTVLGNIPPPSTVTYLLADHLGTPRVGTDAQGQVVWRWESTACGDTLATGSSTMNLRFAGQYYDKETGLFYNWNRYYDPKLCRYTQSDRIGLAGGSNTFTYAENNPLKYTDRTGNAIDTVADIGFIFYDLYRIGADNVFGDKGNLGENCAALGADVGGFLIPGATGLGLGVRAAKSTKATKALRNESPSLDRTGKVHGALPRAEDLSRYPRDELHQLQRELQQSVQQRIRRTSELGPDKAHGQRQAAEQQLIIQIEKYLSGS